MEQGSGPIVVAGKYTLVERLDASGVFETYRATDSSGRTLVVKKRRHGDDRRLAGTHAHRAAGSIACGTKGSGHPLGQERLTHERTG
jgi:hypothetical protein